MAVVSLILIAIPLFVYLRAVRLDVHDEGGRSDRHRDCTAPPAPRRASGTSRHTKPTG